MYRCWKIEYLFLSIIKITKKHLQQMKIKTRILYNRCNYETTKMYEKKNILHCDN